MQLTVVYYTCQIWLELLGATTEFAIPPKLQPLASVMTTEISFISYQSSRQTTLVPWLVQHLGVEYLFEHWNFGTHLALRFNTMFIVQHDKWKLEFSVMSPCLYPIFGLAFTPLSPLSVVSAKYWNLKKNLSTKCWNSAFNVQSSRVLIIVTGSSSENIGSSNRGALEKERQDET
jgi:hypothetical protein